MPSIVFPSRITFLPNRMSYEPESKRLELLKLTLRSKIYTSSEKYLPTKVLGLVLREYNCQSLPITRHHLHPAPLSVTPRAFHSKLKCHLFKHSYTLTHLIIHPSNLNDTHLNSYSVPFWYSGNRT